jgi:hypothetical protein
MASYEGWKVGDYALRKNRLCRIQKIHFDEYPPHVTVQMLDDNNEIGTEFNKLTRVTPGEVASMQSSSPEPLVTEHGNQETKGHENQEATTDNVDDNHDNNNRNNTGNSNEDITLDDTNSSGTKNIGDGDIEITDTQTSSPIAQRSPNNRQKSPNNHQKSSNSNGKSINNRERSTDNHQKKKQQDKPKNIPTRKASEHEDEWDDWDDWIQIH